MKLGNTTNLGDGMVAIRTPQFLPEFPGGEAALISFINEQIKYPKARPHITGVVYVKFNIDSNGVLNNPKVLKGLDSTYDKEALRIINLLPNWSPAMDNGKRVEYDYVFPIEFKD